MRSGEVLDGVVRQLRRQLGDAPTDGELLAQFAAREHLKTLAAGQPAAEPTVAASAALQRLQNRP
jgi:hypothetical protein